MGGGQVRTWTIWSSFLMESRLGPVEALSALPGPPGPSVAGRSETGRDLGVVSLGLFVLVGFVWGEEAGEETLGGCRGC